MRQAMRIYLALGSLLGVVASAACQGSTGATSDSGTRPDFSLVPDAALPVDASHTDGSNLVTVPPVLMMSEGSGTALSAGGGRSLDILLGQPIGLPFFLDGQSRIEPGLYPQTRIKP